MDLTKATNIALRLNGSATVNRIDENDVNSREAAELVRESRTDILSEGWSFNTDQRTLTADTTGRIPIQTNWLEVRLPRNLSTRKHSDGKVYIWDVVENDWETEDQTKIEIVFDIDQDDDFTIIPEEVARYIAVNGGHLLWLKSKAGVVNQLILNERRAARRRALNTEPAASVNRTSGWNARRSRYTRVSARSQ